MMTSVVGRLETVRSMALVTDKRQRKFEDSVGGCCAQGSGLHETISEVDLANYHFARTGSGLGHWTGYWVSIGAWLEA